MYHIPGVTAPFCRQACILPQTMLARQLGFPMNQSYGLPSLYPVLPASTLSATTTPTWNIVTNPVQQVMSFPQTVTGRTETILTQSFGHTLTSTVGSNIIEQGVVPINAVTDNSIYTMDRVDSPATGLDKLRMKKGDQGTTNTAFILPLSKKKGKRQVKQQPKPRAPRRIWNDEEHTAYLRFVRHKAVGGKIDDRILTDIPTRTLLQIRQYNYKYITYRNNGLEVVDSAFNHNPEIVRSFSNFLDTIFSKYFARGEFKTGIALEVYDATAFQWNLYHSIRILDSTLSVTTSQGECDTIPPFSPDIYKSIYLGVTEIVHKHVFRHTFFKIVEFVRFLINIRKYINDPIHTQAYDHLVEFILQFINNVDITRCNGKITVKDLEHLFSLCKNPSNVDKVLHIAATMTPFVYVSFQYAAGDVLSASKVISNLQSCHIHIPYIHQLVYQMLCSIATQICYEIGPKAYLYISTIFLVYLQILNGTVEEIAYEIYKHASSHCTNKTVSEQSILVLCIITYILCFAAIHREESNAE